MAHEQKQIPQEFQTFHQTTWLTLAELIYVLEIYKKIQFSNFFPLTDIQGALYSRASAWVYNQGGKFSVFVIQQD